VRDVPPSAEAPRVVRIITRLNVGGPARQAILLTDVLRPLGYETELVWGAEEAEEGRIEIPVGVPNTHLRDLRRALHPAHDPKALRALARLLTARRPQVVHTHMAKAGALGRVAAWRSKVPVVVHTFHGHVLEGYFSRPVSAAYVAAERSLARISHALIAVSPAVRDELLSLGIGRPSQWRVIPVGLDLGDLLEADGDPVAARRAVGLPEDGPVVGIVGRLVPVKDHVTFLEAAARIRRERPDVTFVVAGDGELRAVLEEQARRTLGGDRCRFLGWVKDLRSLYGAIDVAVLTSRNEGTPVALIEAAAASKPVVATRVGGVADVVVDGRTGHLCPPGDPTAVATAVLELLGDPTQAHHMGAAARETVRERFTIERLANDLADLYRELLDANLHRLGGRVGSRW